jgi:hypothetical protein
MDGDKITIFVHGTLPPLTGVSFIYNFFFCPPGLTRADELDKKFHLSKIAHLLAEQAPRDYSVEHFYFFGWSGKLSIASRREAAKNLYESLKKLISTYKVKPSIRIITHSHGGNVALYLNDLEKDPELSIDELILLACPVQVETAHCLEGAVFERIFSFYSEKDLLQVLDPQGIHRFLENLKQYGLEFTVAHLNEMGPFFSQRRFQPTHSLKQLYIKHPQREFLHIEFLLPPFIKALPGLIKLINNRQNTEEPYIFNAETD